MMSKINDGGPAFPVSSPVYHHAEQGEFLGMSLRDWLAGQALAGYLAMCSDPEIETLPAPPIVADKVYKYADAMLAHRGK